MLFGPDDYLDLVKDWEDPNPFPVLVDYDGIVVVRDDLQEGGSKVRFADKLIRDTPVDEFCYGGSNSVGWGNISLAYLCRKYGKMAHSFYADRKEPTPHQKYYSDLGGKITWVKMGMLSVTKAHCKKYVEQSPTTRMNVPIGLEHDITLGAIIKVARNLPIIPEVVWTVGSSGTLTRGLQMAWPDSEFHCVQTGHKMDQEEAGNATVHPVSYKYNQPCKEEDLPPFPSAREYDAKVWKPMKELYNPQKVNLFWNVAGDPK